MLQRIFFHIAPFTEPLLMSLIKPAHLLGDVKMSALLSELSRLHFEVVITAASSA